MSLELDAETRSDIDLKRRGAYVYFESPNTDCLMISYKLNGGPKKRWRRGQPCPPEIVAHVATGGVVSAHNAAFERLLWWNILTPRYGWPVLPLDQVRCTAATAAAMALPRDLETLGEALDLPIKKDKAGKNLIRKFSIPRKPRAGEDPNGLYFNEPEDFPADFESFHDYCDDDVETEAGADRRMVPLSTEEQEIYTIDQRINDRGIRIDRRSAIAALNLAEKAKKLLDKEMRAATGGFVPACSQPGKLVEWVQMQGVTMNSAAKAEITDLLDQEDLPAHVRKAILIRQEAAKTSVSKLQAMLDRANKDGRVRGTNIYHGASTGRWVNVGVNFNNLPRPRKIFEEVHPNREQLFQAIRSEDPDLLRFLYPETPKPYAPEIAPYLMPSNDGELGRPLHLISDALRSFIWAAPGHDLLQADYSGIEGAVAAWLADEDWKVKALFDIAADPKLPDMYRQTAAFILNSTTDVITKKHPLRQAIGKTAELALGFGGGCVAFMGMARNYSIRLRPIYEPVWAATDEERRTKAAKRYESVSKRKREGTDVLDAKTWIACELVKVGWRAANPRIAESWHDLEDAVREAIRNPGQQVKTLGGRISYIVRLGFLWCRLPSGRCLAYGSPKLKDQVWAKVKLDDGSWSDAEVMDRIEAEGMEARGRVLIQGNTSPRITVLGVDGVTKKWVRQGLYGGLIFENCVQAIARDLLVNGMRKAEAAGYPVIAHVYDELITEVPRGWGDLQAFEKLICELPDWAAGMPLTAGGWRGKRYRKD
jgi:DNA polymerase